MNDSTLARGFVVLRGMVYAACFVMLWTWVATTVRPLDDRIPFGIPAGLEPIAFVLISAGTLLTAYSILTLESKLGESYRRYKRPWAAGCRG